MNRRFAIIAGLSVVELWIIGLMIRSLTCGSHQADVPASTARLFTAPAQAAGLNRTTRTIETGPAPRVIIDDDNATLSVSVRAGTTVDISEQTQSGGWMRESTRLATVEKTSDGVSIVRADGGLSIGFGSSARRLDVVVPPGAQLEVKNAGSTTVTGLRAALSLHSDDGSIVVSDHRGAVDIKTDNGRIELNDVEASSIDVSSDNGRVALDRVTADEATIVTDNGRIEVLRSLLRGGKIQTDSGRIRLALDPRSDVTVRARASAGQIIAESPLTSVATGDDDDAPSAIRVGSGAGRLDVGSDDGSITISAGRV